MRPAPRSVEEWLEQNPPDPSRFTQTLAVVARRALAGEDFRLAAREFLDEFALAPSDAVRVAAIREEPPPTGEPRHDAYLAALAEHLAALGELQRPGWVCKPERFLDRFWYVSEVPGFRATAIAQSPAAFRRRGIFIARDALSRV